MKRANTTQSRRKVLKRRNAAQLSGVLVSAPYCPKERGEMACQGGGAEAIRLTDKQVKGNIRGMGGAAVRQGGGARGAARLSS